MACCSRSSGGTPPKSGRSLDRRAGWLLVAAIVFAGFFPRLISATTERPWLLSLLFSVLPLLLASTLPLWVRLPDPGGRAAWVIRKLSLYSYIIYLCHIPIMFWCDEHIARAIGGRMGAIIGDLVALVGIVIVSALVHHLFEKPIMNLRPTQSRTAA